jgi:polyhydroxyalkanoate synthase subunit PhaC
MSQQLDDTERRPKGRSRGRGGARTERRGANGAEAPPAKAPDLLAGREGREADTVAAAVAGGEAIGPVGSLGGIDPRRLLGGLLTMADPRRAPHESLRAAARLVGVVLGATDVELPERDKRFADPAWRENPLYRRVGQSYVVVSEAMDRLADGPDAGGDWRRAAQARYTSSLLSAFAAPTNVLPGNPAALKRAFDTAGLSVARGALHFAHDLVANGGMPSQVDTRPFVVGENLAATAGAVVYRDDICELLQYAPSTARIRSRPLLMVPPQVNKHYFLDLAPGRSLVEYLVQHGVPFFSLVWRNPTTPDHGAWGLEAYVAAQLRALDVVAEISGSDDVNLLGACAGGLTSALMLGYLAAHAQDRVRSATFAISMIDSSYPNVLSLTADERLLRRIDKDAKRRKVYDRNDVARTFAWMRPNDLVFNYVINNWLMGNDPPAFDVLAWNNDGTNLSARFDGEMLRIYARNAAAHPGAVTVLDTPIDLGRIECDNCIIAGRTDHITPWMPCYMTSRLLPGPSEVIVTSTGHIQTIVNPPGKPRARYFTGPEPGPDPQAWLRDATEVEGSWWPRYAEWLLARSGDERDAPARLGSRRHPPGDPAPGRYVLE